LLRLREVHAKPKMIGLVISGAEDFLRLRRERSHALAAPRSGADQDQAPHEVGRLKGDLLRDKAADRKAEHIDLRQSPRLDKRDCVGRHFLERGRNLAGAARDAGVVEQNDLALRREAIGHRRIPMVHRPGEVLVENERYAVRLAVATIGEADAVGLDELRRRGLVGMNHYGRALITQPAPHRVRALGLLSRSRRRSSPWALRSPRSPRQLLRSPYWETLHPTPPHAQAWGCQPK